MLEGFFFFFCYSSQKIQMIQSPRCPLKEGLEFILGKRPILTERTGAPCPATMLAYFHTVLSKNGIFTKQ